MAKVEVSLFKHSLVIEFVKKSTLPIKEMSQSTAATLELPSTKSSPEVKPKDTEDLWESNKRAIDAAHKELDRLVNYPEGFFQKIARKLHLDL